MEKTNSLARELVSMVFLYIADINTWRRLIPLARDLVSIGFYISQILTCGDD